MDIRSAEELEIDHLATIWHSGWQEAHARILPAELAQYRTFESFRQRLRADHANVRVAGLPGQPIGFCMTKDDEVNQLYLSEDARGTGVATALLRDAEQVLRTQGVKTAWLACAIGNKRAARFYEKNSWIFVGNMICQIPIQDGTFQLEVWRYELNLKKE